MAVYTKTINISLGMTNTGLSLEAELRDLADELVGSPITMGFYERGGGMYRFTYAAFPDDFRGDVVFYEQGQTEVLWTEAVNPEDRDATAAKATAADAKAAAESADGKLPDETADLLANLDAAVSSRSSHDAAAAGAAAATAILATPAHKVATDAEGKVTAANAPTTTQINAALTAAHGAGDWRTGNVAGDGDIPVDHDTGGSDALRYVAAGVGVDNGVIRAWRKAEWDAGVKVCRGTAYTGTDGRWASPMMLNAGVYYLDFSKPGVYAATRAEVTVA